jgi:hypothetical protein
MSLKITHKNSTTAGTPPSAGDIDVGEIAMNAADAELYTKDTAGNIKKFANTDTTGTAAGVQFTQAGTGAVERTVESKLQDVVSVLDFIPESEHADIKAGTSTYDATDDIQAAIDSLQGSSKTLYISNGNYLISRTGTVFIDFTSANRDYALLVTDTLSIIAEGKFTFATNGLTTRCNAFVFDAVSNFSFEGGHFESTEPSGAVTKQLYNGVPILANSCTNGRIFNVNALNTSGCVLALSSKSVTISNCFYSKLGNVQSGSSFGIYGGTGNLIERCITYGGTQDGDIGLYGTGSFNRISLCRAHAFKITDATQTPVSTGLQGIYVDAGQHNATVGSCFAQGYYYGIDVKSNISNCFVLGNTLYKNKVSIAARRGELNTDSMDVSIQDNLIIPVTGNGNNDSVSGGYTVLGIFVQDFASVLIQGNEFTTSYNTSTTENWVAVRATSKAYNEAQRGVLALNNNKLKYSQSLGGNTSRNTQQNYFDLSGYTGASLQILGNSFSHVSGNAGRIAISTFKDALVSGNSVANTSYSSATNIPFVVLSEVNSALINSNSLSNNQGLVSYTKNATTGSATAQLVVSGNTLASTNQNSHTMIQTDGVLGCVITGNIRFRPQVGAPFGDSKLLVATNATATSKFAFVGNVLRQTNYGLSNYYTIDGVDAATGSNILVNDMV